MKLLIRNMMSRRCMLAVQKVLEHLEIGYRAVYIGGADLLAELNATQHKMLAAGLREYGLELAAYKNSVIIEKIEAVVQQMITMDELPEVSYSVYISEQLGTDYTYLSKMFLGRKGISIQQYIIDRKIERVKQLLREGKLSLTEIAYRLNYSSVAHLSHQFKKNTGVRPRDFIEHPDDNNGRTTGADDDMPHDENMTM